MFTKELARPKWQTNLHHGASASLRQSSNNNRSSSTTTSRIYTDATTIIFTATTKWVVATREAQTYFSIRGNNLWLLYEVTICDLV